MDGFIYEIIKLTIDDPTWVNQSKNATLMAIHTKFWPLQTSYTLSQDYPLAIRKLAVEEHLTQHKACLGWGI